MFIANRPSACALAFMTFSNSAGTVAVRSTSSSTGCTSVSTKRRTVSTSRRVSSGSEKSIMAVFQLAPKAGRPPLHEGPSWRDPDRLARNHHRDVGGAVAHLLQHFTGLRAERLRHQTYLG